MVLNSSFRFLVVPGNSKYCYSLSGLLPHVIHFLLRPKFQRKKYFVQLFALSNWNCHNGGQYQSESFSQNCVIRLLAERNGQQTKINSKFAVSNRFIFNFPQLYKKFENEHHVAKVKSYLDIVCSCHKSQLPKDTFVANSVLGK